MADILKLVAAKDDEDARIAHERTMKFLEEGIERARAQKATFALVIMLTPDGAVIDGYSADAMMRPYTVIGALEDIKMRFRDKNIEQR